MYCWFWFSFLKKNGAAFLLLNSLLLSLFGFRDSLNVLFDRLFVVFETDKILFLELLCNDLFCLLLCPLSTEKAWRLLVEFSFFELLKKSGGKFLIFINLFSSVSLRFWEFEFSLPSFDFLAVVKGTFLLSFASSTFRGLTPSFNLPLSGPLNILL